MKTLLCVIAAVCGSLLLTLVVHSNEPTELQSPWTTLLVPGVWDDQHGGKLAGYDGFAWYRCYVLIPANWD